MPTILFPKDVFIRLNPADVNDGTPSQGILFGLREKSLDQGLIVHVKGFVPYISNSQDLVSTIAKYMNWNGQTVLGWFAAPTMDVLQICDATSIASAYFRSVQSAMLQVIAANHLSRHIEYDVKEIPNLIAQESYNLFQDLIGIVIGGHTISTNKTTNSPATDILSTRAQAFVSTPTLIQVLNQLQSLAKEPEINTNEMQQHASDPLSTEFDGLALLAAAVSSTISDNHDTDVISKNDSEEEGGKLGELNAVWGHGLPSTSIGGSKVKQRTRRASTTDIVDSRNLRTTINTLELPNGSSKKRKDIEGVNSGRVSKKKTKTVITTTTDDVKPVPFNIISGQGSEYLHESHSANSFYHSTEFDESVFPTLTASFFTPIENSTISTQEYEIFANTDVCTPAEQRIKTAFNAITYHLTTHTQEKIELYEKSCREYEMLMKILEGLGKAEEDEALVKRLESSMDTGSRRKELKSEMESAEVTKEENLHTSIESFLHGGEKIKKEILAKELEMPSSENLLQENIIEGEQSGKNSVSKLNKASEYHITGTEPPNSDKEVIEEIPEIIIENGKNRKSEEEEADMKPEEGEVLDERLLIVLLKPDKSNQKSGNGNIAETILSSTEDGEIDDDDPGIFTKSRPRLQRSPIFNVKPTSHTNSKEVRPSFTSIPKESNSRQLEIPKEKSTTRIKSPDWAWDDEELG